MKKNATAKIASELATAQETTLKFTISQKWTQKQNGVSLGEFSSTPYTMSIHFKDGANLGQLIANEINYLFNLVGAQKAVNQSTNFFKMSAQTDIKIEKVINGENFTLCRFSNFKAKNLLGTKSKQKFARLVVFTFAELLGMTQNKNLSIAELIDGKGKLNEEIKPTAEFYEILKQNSILLSEKIASLEPAN